MFLFNTQIYGYFQVHRFLDILQLNIKNVRLLKNTSKQIYMYLVD